MTFGEISDARVAAVLWAMALAAIILLGWRLRSSQQPVSAVAAAIMVVLLVLGIQAARYQVLQQDAIAGRIGIDPDTAEVVSNPRTMTGDLEDARGTIYAADGRRLAWSVESNGMFIRQFDPLADSGLTGYFSPLLYGKSGLEAALDDELAGKAGRSTVEQIAGSVGIGPSGPLDVHLAVEPGLQELADSLLDVYTGAAVVIDVRTGAILAMASSPRLSPSRLATGTDADVANAQSYWRELLQDPGRPLVNRATKGLYPPGSTFKAVTASAAIDSGLANPETVYTDDGSLEVDGHLITEVNRPDDTVTEWTLAEGFAYSLNVVFAQVGLQLGSESLTDYAQAWGIGERVPFETVVSPGQIASSDSFLDAPAALADTAFGQGELLVTPLEMALIAAGIANDGQIMKPHIVARTAETDGETVVSTQPEVWKIPITAETAGTMQALMVQSVETGYAANAAIPGYRVGGKTGTAESGTDVPHGWFIGFAGESEPEFAVAVVLEHGGEGSGVPALIGAQLLGAALDLPR